ncbi:MAG: MBL fold metallo-hydrolase [Isosphaeraceae bacterium]
MPRRHALTLIIVTGLGVLSRAKARADELSTYEVYAVRYARLRDFPVSALVQGADRGRKLDIAMTVWVLQRPDGRIVLVDAGFYRPRLLKQWKGIADYTRPDKAVERLGIKPEQVTDIVVTHMHWDHADGVDLFPKARIWIQKDEYDYYTRAARQSGGKDQGTEPDFVSAMVTPGRSSPE